MTTEDQTRWHRAPKADSDLHWLFNESDAAMGFRSGHGSAVNIGHVGVRVSSHGSCDARITDELVGSPGNSKGRREGAAGRQGRLNGYLRQLSRIDQGVLVLAYGPVVASIEFANKTKSAWPGVMFLSPSARKAYSAASPELKRKDMPVFSPRPRASDAFDKLGEFKSDARGVLWMPSVAEAMPFVDWLTDKAKKDVLRDAETDAARMVHEAWNRWADIRGRRRKRVAVRMVADGEDLGPMGMG